MIDNLELIKPLLNFENKGDFYVLYVFKRKKDQTTDKANHQSVRTIKSYCVDSIEYLEQRYDEIKQLCEMFKARAYIHVQKQNHNDVALEMIPAIVKRIQSGQINQKHVFDSVVGQLKTYEKRWVVDIDVKDENYLIDVMSHINDHCRPIGVKINKVIPTKSGVHLITDRFDVMEFKKRYPDIDIQKKNPTLLYYPTSLSIVKRKITLWMQGFSATGQAEGASMIGSYEATDLDDAVKQYMETHKGEVEWDRYGRGRHAIWACEIFDNEEQARKSFG